MEISRKQAEKTAGYSDHFAQKPVVRHTSGHAYVSSIARVIETVDPKHIIVMHTECADEFSAIPAFEKYKDRILSVQDGQTISLDDL